MTYMTIGTTDKANLTLGANALTQTFGILAIRGAGKTYTGKVFAEEFQKSNGQVICIDPTGVWWGLTSSADGKKAGLSIIVIGGEHGNVPLESSAGKVIARFIVESKHSVILDVSDFSGGELVRFMTDFATELFHLKARDRYPLHLMIDEADTFAPQRPFPKEAQMLGAMEKLVKQGRSRGIGCTLITQRPATLNKNVLTQIETLIVLRMTAPRDRKAIDEWVEAHGTPEERKIMMESLASLPNGTAWFWSPSWLKVFDKVKIRKLETFDSSATPDAGMKQKQIQRSTVDISKLSEEIKSTIEKAKENDPAELKRQILSLKKELAVKSKDTKAPTSPSVSPEFVKAVKQREKENEEFIKRFRILMSRLTNSMSQVFKQSCSILEDLDTLTKQEKIDWSKIKTVTMSVSPNPPKHVEFGNPKNKERVESKIQSEVYIAPVQERILSAIANLESLGITDIPRIQVAVFSGYSNTASTGFAKAIGALRTNGLIDYPSSGTICLTNEGRAIAPKSDVPLSSEELQERVIKLIEPVGGRILRVIIECYPEPILRTELAEKTGYSNTASTGFAKAIGRLRSLGLIEYPNTGTCIASSLLFID